MTSLDLAREADWARCGALKDFWYVACLSRELGTKRPVGRTLLGVPLALYRDAAGHAQAVRDRCAHRGAALSEGVVIDGTLCCPYHGWSYGAGGRCLHIPSLGPGQRGVSALEENESPLGLKLAPEEVPCLETFPTHEADGLVFVFLGGDPARARRPPFRVPFANDPAWRVYFMVTRFPNGVTNLVENFMDVPHTVFVHRGWFRTQKRKRVPATVERKNGEVLVTYQQDNDRLSGLGLLLNPTGEPMVHTDHFIVPNVTRVDYLFGKRSGFVIHSQCSPVGAMDSWVYTAISYRLPLDLPGNLLARVLEPLVHAYTRQVITQDVEIMGAQARGLSRGPWPVVFHNTEADLLHGDIEAYRRWLVEGAMGPGPADATRSIEFWI